MLIRVRSSTLRKIQDRISRLERSVGIFGWAKTLRSLWKRVIQGRRHAHPMPPRDLRHPFDLDHGVETSGLIDGTELSQGHEHDRYNLAYYGVQPSVFRAACRRWALTLPAIAAKMEDFTFIDVGAGKGRAVLLASELPFEEVLGVELSEPLVSVASRNIGIWRQSGRGHQPMRVICQDATEVSWPPTPLLIYLFNPFGWRVLKELIERLEASFRATPRPIDLLYINPEFHSVLDNHPAIEKLWSERIEITAVEQAADWFGSTGELCAAYRFRIEVAGH